VRREGVGREVERDARRLGERPEEKKTRRTNKERTEEEEIG
jgi:hypothetical protein